MNEYRVKFSGIKFALFCEGILFSTMLLKSRHNSPNQCFGIIFRNANLHSYCILEDRKILFLLYWQFAGKASANFSILDSNCLAVISNFVLLRIQTHGKRSNTTIVTLSVEMLQVDQKTKQKCYLLKSVPVLIRKEKGILMGERKWCLVLSSA